MNIERNEQMSPGGTCSPLIKILIASAANTSVGVPPEANGRLIGAWGGLAPLNLIEIHAVRDTIDFQEQQTEINGTLMFNQTMRLIVHRPTFDRLNALHKITAYHWMAFFNTNLNEQKMFGRRHAGCAIRFGTEGKTDRLQPNEAIIEITSLQAKPSPIVESPI